MGINDQCIIPSDLCCVLVLYYVCHTFTPFIAVVRSCSELKTCNSQYSDGEYWLNRAPFGTTRVKIYCHNMNSGSPVEYVTLNVINRGYYPRKSSQECNGEVTPGCATGAGETMYNKIRVNIQVRGFIIIIIIIIIIIVVFVVAVVVVDIYHQNRHHRYHQRQFWLISLIELS